MDSIDKNLLNILQSGVPLHESPFLKIGEELKISEDDCIKRIKKLKDDNIIRQISPIFDTKSLGYKGTLAAMKFSADKIDKAAEIVGSHPGVTHNYERNHDINLWFTIAVNKNSDLEKHINKLAELSNAEEVFILPTLKLFKIGVNLDITGKRDVSKRSKKKDYYSEKAQSQDEIILTELEKKAIYYLQDDLNLTSNPFDQISEKIGISTENIFEMLKDFKERGIMRRFAAVLRHREAGFSANLMGVWNVPQEKIEECGEIMASYMSVSHCYYRPTYPNWPYSMFTMIHGQSIDECKSLLADISKNIGITDYFGLLSTKEYKKVRMKYFTGEIEKWEEENGL